MENNTPKEAQAALNDLDATRSGLADRLVAPGWFHPLLGLLVGQMVLVYGLSADGLSLWPIVSAAVMIVGAVVLIVIATRVSGVTITRPAGQRSGVMFWGIVALIAIPLLVVLTTETGIGQSIAWALIAFVGVAIVGRFYLNAYRSDLREEVAPR